MAGKRQDANLNMLQETTGLQGKTKDAVVRMNRQAAEAEEVGGRTLEELRRQGHQMDEISNELTAVDRKLEQSKALENKFDWWAGNWLGGKRRTAMKEAAAQIQDRNNLDHSKVREVFQHQKYDSLSRTWKAAGMVLCSDPSVSCDLFDPDLQEKMEVTHWKIDYSMSGIDLEGWTYAKSFAALNQTGAGSSEVKWNYYVRRRKWRFSDTTASSVAIGEVLSRNEVRKQAARKHEAMLGLAPRNIRETTHRADEQSLDEQSAAGLARVRANDQEIDAGLTTLTHKMDTLHGIGQAMREEATAQNKKLDRLTPQLENTMEKQIVTNARLTGVLRAL